MNNDFFVKSKLLDHKIKQTLQFHEKSTLHFNVSSEFFREIINGYSRKVNKYFNFTKKICNVECMQKLQKFTSTLFDQNFVKAMILAIKIPKSRFHDIFHWREFFHTVIFISLHFWHYLICKAGIYVSLTTFNMYIVHILARCISYYFADLCISMKSDDLFLLP